MKKVLLIALAFCATTAWAEVNVEPEEEKKESEFLSEERIETGILNNLLEKVTRVQKENENKPSYGRKVTDYISIPKVGGYFIGKYAYNSDNEKNKTAGFSQRLIRFYVDGTILKDFSYRIQLQCNNASFHMKDYYVEWGRFKEVKIKIGQYKRAFGFENPMNPWDVGVGDYSQLTKKLTGHNDYVGAENSSNGVRDQGIQVQGDLFPIGKDKHRLIHYQVMVANGQGINSGDANSNKDVLGTIQVQPVKGLFVGFFGWIGKFTSNNITVDRKRFIVGAKYDWRDWTFRAEYGRANGHKIKDYVAADPTTGTPERWVGTGKADAFYATVGIPALSWLKVYLKYDLYRDQANAETSSSIYTICPNFQLHKNLQFQLQYNYCDSRLTEQKYHELWVEAYVRF